MRQRYDVRYSRRYRCLCQETDEEAAERNENLSIKQGIPTTCKVATRDFRIKYIKRTNCKKGVIKQLKDLIDQDFVNKFKT